MGRYHHRCINAASLGTALVAGLTIGSGCAKTTRQLGIDVQMIAGPNVDMSRIAALEFYLNERAGEPAFSD